MVSIPPVVPMMARMGHEGAIMTEPQDPAAAQAAASLSRDRHPAVD
jgi:hypothetical protein